LHRRRPSSFLLFHNYSLLHWDFLLLIYTSIDITDWQTELDRVFSSFQLSIFSFSQLQLPMSRSHFEAALSGLFFGSRFRGWPSPRQGFFAEEWVSLSLQLLLFLFVHFDIDSFFSWLTILVMIGHHFFSSSASLHWLSALFSYFLIADFSSDFSSHAFDIATPSLQHISAVFFHFNILFAD